MHKLQPAASDKNKHSYQKNVNKGGGESSGGSPPSSSEKAAGA